VRCPVFCYVFDQLLISVDPPDLKRLYKLRDALKELDVGDATSDNLRQQLLRCVIHPYLLLNPEGKKFIAHLMVVDHRFVDAVHRTVKSVVRRSLMEYQ
jgi:condensin-2 complex subunit G2